MANMRILIRIVFVIFIANGIDCLGSDNCCNFSKYKDISKGENYIVESLVAKYWYINKENKPILKIFEKKNNDVFAYEGIKYKISNNKPGLSRIVEKFLRHICIIFSPYMSLIFFKSSFIYPPTIIIIS